MSEHVLTKKWGDKVNKAVTGKSIQFARYLTEKK